MNRYLVSAIVIAVAGGTMFARAQQPQQPQQERQLSVSLTDREWLSIGAVLDEQKVKDFGPLVNKIQGQLSQQLQQAAAQAQNNFEKQVRDRIAADAAKAAEDKAKADAAPQAAEPEKPK